MQSTFGKPGKQRLHH